MIQVNHLSIAVRDMGDALAFFQRHFPVVMHNQRAPGHSGDYAWCDFFIGDFKLEIIESAAPGSFVERFIAKRGEGLHHLSMKASNFDETIAALEGGGVRIVDRFDASPEGKTAFISPRSGFGTLIQFWSDFGDEPSHPPIATKRYAGEEVRMQVNHVALAVRSIAPALEFFERFFPITLGKPTMVGYEPSFRLANFFLNGYKIELIEQNPEAPAGFVTDFLNKRGEGFHHVSIHVDRIGPVLESLEADGVRIAARARGRNGNETAFISPRSAFGVLIQFWEHPGLGAEA